MKKEPRWIDLRDALAIHDRLLSLHGGASGFRDRSLLESALARPGQHYSHADRAKIVDMAALFTAGIVRNHPFIDGNRRTGFVVGILFLELNGYSFTAAEADSAQAVLALAGGTLDHDSYSDWLRLNAKRSKVPR
jgi:death on curing protein